MELLKLLHGWGVPFNERLMSTAVYQEDILSTLLTFTSTPLTLTQERYRDAEIATRVRCGV